MLTLRAGYNFGNNPSPGQTMSPTRQVVFEHHLSVGAGCRLAKHWQLDGGLVYARRRPFGPNAQESPSGLSVGLTLGYRY